MARNRSRSHALRAARALRALVRSVRGGTTIEYGLILAFIVLMMFGALMQMADVTKGMWNDISTRVTSAR